LRQQASQPAGQRASQSGPLSALLSKENALKISKIQENIQKGSGNEPQHPPPPFPKKS